MIYLLIYLVLMLTLIKKLLLVVAAGCGFLYFLTNWGSGKSLAIIGGIAAALSILLPNSEQATVIVGGGMVYEAVKDLPASKLGEALNQLQTIK